MASPDSVRVWRGFKLKELNVETYYSKLGEVLIPTTIQMQSTLGLTAYLPTVLPYEKFETIPDEIALVFYESKDVYQHTFKTTAGRAYGLLHSAIFDFHEEASKSDFPILLNEGVEWEQPYYLFEDCPDWQAGKTRVLVGARKASQETEEFKDILFNALKQLQTLRPVGLDGVYFVVSNEYVVYWEHWDDEATALRSWINNLAEITSLVLLKDAENIPIPSNLDEDYEGLVIKGGECLNTVFKRHSCASCGSPEGCFL